MSKEKNILHLNDGEKILGIVRRSFVSELFKIIFVCIWILLPFFFFFPLLRLGLFGFFLFAILAVGGLLYAFKIWMNLSYTMLIVTSQRVIDVEHHGLFDRDIAEAGLSSVSSVKVLKRNIFQRIISSGTVKVKTKKSDKFDIEIDGVRKPQTVRQFVEDVKELSSKYEIRN